ncbi:MAG: hypothetical protein IJH04_08720, partial [Eggerthellaceae bacterium]|nr:hypothetical protein [Eggerthellaceae bacterium]
RSLHQAGFASFYFGVESADDVVLKRVNKGYDSAELYEAGMKLKESGMPWTCAIMLGLGGHDYGLDHAIKTAEFFTATEPTIIGCVSLTLVYDHYTCMEPPLKKLVEAGKFVEAGEIERYKELRAFIDHLDARTFFTCQHSTMPVGFSAVLPDQKKDLLASIDAVIEEGDEAGMAWFRDRVKEV